MLFTAFDKKCLINHVFKLYTIGDCYVVMGVENVSKRDYVQEAENVVSMASAMLDEIKRIRKDFSFPLTVELDMRIGIHTVIFFLLILKSFILIFHKGNIIGGVIGSDIARYDIFGDTVLIANKIEEEATEGCIFISETTKKLLEKNNLYFFDKSKKVSILDLGTTIEASMLCRKSATSISDK